MTDNSAPRRFDRRKVLISLLGGAAATAAVPSAFASTGPARRGSATTAARPVTPGSRPVYVGTYTGSGSEGIYILRLDPATGVLTHVGTQESSNPSYLALNPAESRLYAANENEDGNGRISAFRIDRTDGSLTPLNSVRAGALTTHVSVHPSGRYVFGANYDGGDFPVFRIEEGGPIGARTDVFASTGTGPSPRQDRPRAHQIVTMAGSGVDVLLGVDLGADKVNVLKLNVTEGTVRAHGSFSVEPGSGPRHLAVHPDARTVYLLNELVSTVSVFRYDPATEKFSPVQTVDALPAAYTGENHAAEIRVHPSGRFVYSTNRGHESIATFAVDPSTGNLTSTGFTPTRGAEPRGMNIDPSGQFLFAANLNTDTVETFRVDQADGGLTHVASVEVPSPSDIQFGPESAQSSQ